MAVAYDAATEFETNDPPDPITFNHTPVGTPRGVVVSVAHGITATKHAQAVTYGGETLSLIVEAADTATEPGNVSLWFLGSGIPTGLQAVSIDQDAASGDNTHAICWTFTADTDTEVIDSDELNEDAANPTVTLSAGGRTKISICHMYGGAAAPGGTLAADNTLGPVFDLGPFYSQSCHETTPDNADHTIGWSTLSSEDLALVAVAISEVAGGTGHTANPNDDEDLLDSHARVADSVRSQTDPEGLLDSRTQVSAAQRSQTDPLGLLDDVTRLAAALRTQTDPLGLLDDASYELVGTGEQTFTDPLGLVDTGTAALTHDGDLLGLTDSVSYEQTSGTTQTVTDPLGLLDSVTKVSAAQRSQTDPLGLVDSVTRVAAGARSQTDPLGLVDSATRTATSVKSSTDPLGLTDSVSYDHVPGGGTPHTATITDPLGLTDSRTVVQTIVVTISDGIGLTDTAARTVSFAPIITDLLGLADTATSTVGYLRSLTDPLGLLDPMVVFHSAAIVPRWQESGPFTGDVEGSLGQGFVEGSLGARSEEGELVVVGQEGG